MSKESVAIEKFLVEARRFGIVISQKDVGLELCSGAADVVRASIALRAAADICESAADEAESWCLTDVEAAA